MVKIEIMKLFLMSPWKDVRLWNHTAVAYVNFFYDCGFED